MKNILLRNTVLALTCICLSSCHTCHTKTKITILDGGMGREIKKRGLPFNLSGTEWSASVLLSDKQEHFEGLSDIHLDFINSGANVITISSYSVTPFDLGEKRFNKLGYKLIDKSIQAAEYARQRSRKKNIQIAGSVPPLFGSYSKVPNPRAKQFYPIIVNQLNNDKRIDLILIETISSIQEAKFAMDPASLNKKPYWISFKLDDTRNGYLQSGEKISDIKNLIVEYKQNPPKAILFNCSHPEVINYAIQEIKKLNLDIKIGAYANLFQEAKTKTFDGLSAPSAIREDISPEKYAALAKEWIKSGGTIVGGCCGVGPKYIKVLSKRVK